MKRRLVGIAVLSLVILVVAWWLPDRNDGQKRLNPERLPTETRVYDIHALNAEPESTVEGENPEAEAESPPNIAPEFGQLAANENARSSTTEAKPETEAVAPAPIETTAARSAVPKPAAQPASKPAPKPAPVTVAQPKPSPKPATVAKAEPKPAPKPVEKPAAKPEPVEAKKPAQTLPSGGWVIQVGSYGKQANADAMRKKLEAKGYRVMVTSSQVNGKTFHRVRVGPYPKKTDAQGSAINLEKMLGQKVVVQSNN